METDKGRLMEILCAAVEIKEKMKALYEDAARKCSDNVGSETFRMLRRTEEEQLDGLRELYAELANGGREFNSCRLYDFGAEDKRAILQRIAGEGKLISRACLDDVAAIESGMELENRSIDFFTDRLRNAESPQEREFLMHMIAEERAHYIMLADLKFYYVDPGHWFMEKGRTELDGAGAVS